MNTRRALFAALMLLTTALACAIPGIQSASPSLPTADTRLEVMVAETVSAALELTALAEPVEPTITPTSPPPTVTLTPVLSSSGSTLTQQPDGSTLFVDESAGYEIKIPAGWLAVRINEDEYYDAFTLPQAADSHIQTSLTSIRDQDPNTFRLLVLDIQEGHIKNEIVTNMNFIWDQQTVISLDTDDNLQDLANEMASGIDGLTVSSVEVVVPPSGAPYGLIKSEIGGTNASGAQVTLYQEMRIFNLKAGILVITFTTENGFLETTQPVFDAMLGTLVVDTE